MTKQRDREDYNRVNRLNNEYCKIFSGKTGRKLTTRMKVHGRSQAFKDKKNTQTTTNMVQRTRLTYLKYYSRTTVETKIDEECGETIQFDAHIEFEWKP